MSSCLVALAVSCGDAFFVERGDFSALIDGGMARGFPHLFQRTLSRDSVNVLVCTHNDSDHANGVLEFLQEGFHADECWLPANWLEALHYLLVSGPPQVIEDLLGTGTEERPDDDPSPEQTQEDADVTSVEIVEKLLDERAGSCGFVASAMAT